MRKTAAPDPARPGSLRRETRERLRAHAVRPRRSRGQSFLVAPGIARRIVAAADAGVGGLAQALAVEIGPGAGALTAPLLDRAAHLLAIEVDPRLLALLRERFGDRPNVTWTLGDATAYPFETEVPRLAAGRPACVVANLPYAAGTPILLRLLDCGGILQTLIVMLQREVAERITAPPGGKAYGALTLAVAAHACARRLFTVPPSAFHPRPAVTSAVLEIVPHREPPGPPAEWPAVSALVRAAFGRRRKTLRQSLAGPATGLTPGRAQAALAAAGIDPRRRGETLTLAEFHRLARAVGPAGIPPVDDA